MYEGEKLAIPTLIAPFKVFMSKIVFVSLSLRQDVRLLTTVDEHVMQVTGASGFLGLHIVSQLLDQGYRVRA